ncbi:hypothetical protein F2Q70_00042921 [Brassica cretica]|uniref:Uncharacterized protein n=1 Tax=Brassica cretica TaxID=69181 RepID=A0A8S9KE42_BRACR|nr:hypothetical protein F2Q70_00042921 [Brassica cretica]
MDHNLKVDHLIDHEHKEWNVELVKEFVAEEDVNRILAIKIGQTGRKDSYVWKHSKSGN